MKGKLKDYAMPVILKRCIQKMRRGTINRRLDLYLEDRCGRKSSQGGRKAWGEGFQHARRGTSYFEILTP